MGTAAVGIAPVNSGATSKKRALGGRASQSFIDPSKKFSTNVRLRPHILIRPLTRIIISY